MFMTNGYICHTHSIFGSNLGNIKQSKDSKGGISGAGALGRFKGILSTPQTAPHGQTALAPHAWKVSCVQNQVVDLMKRVSSNRFSP